MSVKSRRSKGSSAVFRPYSSSSHWPPRPWQRSAPSCRRRHRGTRRSASLRRRMCALSEQPCSDDRLAALPLQLGSAGPDPSARPGGRGADGTEERVGDPPTPVAGDRLALDGQDVSDRPQRRRSDEPDHRRTDRGVPAYVYRGRSRIDGKPAWVFNYTPSLVLPVYDEVREVTPGGGWASTGGKASSTSLSYSVSRWPEPWVTRRSSTPARPAQRRERLEPSRRAWATGPATTIADDGARSAHALIRSTNATTVSPPCGRDAGSPNKFQSGARDPPQVVARPIFRRRDWPTRRRR